MLSRTFAAVTLLLATLLILIGMFVPGALAWSAAGLIILAAAGGAMLLVITMYGDDLYEITHVYVGRRAEPYWTVQESRQR